MEEVDEMNEDIDFNIGYVKLYYNDLLKVINILKKTNSEKIRITTDRFKLFSNELNELRNKPIKHMTIETQNSLVLRFGKEFYDDGLTITSWDNSVKSLGIAQQLKAFFKTKKKRLLSLFRFSLISYVSTFLLILQVFLFPIDLKVLQNIFIFYIWLITVSIGTFYIIVYFLVKYARVIKGSQIIMVDKDDLPNFWVRNKDALIVNIIIAIISAIITFLITYSLS